MEPSISAAARLLILVIVGWILPFPSYLRAEDRHRLQIISKDGQVRFVDGQKIWFVYNANVVEPPNGMDPIYRRSGYLHPLRSPSGKLVTDDFSADHAHQHGLFLAMVKVQVGSRTIDFWNQHRRTGGVEHVKMLASPSGGAVEDGPSISSLRVKLRHFAWKEPPSGQAPKGSPKLGEENKETVFEEIWTLGGELQRGCGVLHFQSTLTNDTGSDVTILKNHYGALGVRGAQPWRNAELSDFRFLTSTGKKRENGNQSREKWVAMSGLVDGMRCGLAVIGSDKNRRSPQPVRLHPKMPYFSFAPMVGGEIILKPGGSIVSRYRIVTFDGEVPRKLLEDLSGF